MELLPVDCVTPCFPSLTKGEGVQPTESGSFRFDIRGTRGNPRRNADWKSFAFRALRPHMRCCCRPRDSTCDCHTAFPVWLCGIEWAGATYARGALSLILASFLPLFEVEDTHTLSCDEIDPEPLIRGPFSMIEDSSPHLDPSSAGTKASARWRKDYSIGRGGAVGPWFARATGTAYCSGKESLRSLLAIGREWPPLLHRCAAHTQVPTRRGSFARRAKKSQSCRTRGALLLHL